MDFLCAAAQEHLQKIVTDLGNRGFSVMVDSGSVTVTTEPPKPLRLPKAGDCSKLFPRKTKKIGQRVNRLDAPIRKEAQACSGCGGGPVRAAGKCSKCYMKDYNARKAKKA